MSVHLFNIREAAEYLGVSERRLKELADSGEIPAYRIGGTFLRFKESQLAIAKTSLYNKLKQKAHGHETNFRERKMEALKDFLYFNDFYILSTVIIFIAIILMLST